MTTGSVVSALPYRATQVYNVYPGFQGVNSVFVTVLSCILHIYDLLHREMSSNKSPYYLPVIRGSAGDPSQPNASTAPNFSYPNESSGKHTAYQNPHHGVTQPNAASPTDGATSHDGPLNTILRVPGDSDSDQNTPKRKYMLCYVSVKRRLDLCLVLSS